MAWTETTTLDSPHALPFGNGLGMVTGVVDITEYHQTIVEVTDITGQFSKGTPRVVCDGMTDNGYIVQWVHGSGSFKAYYPIAAYTPILTGTAPAGSTGVVTYLAAAATVGHALYVVPDPGPPVFELTGEAASSAEVNDNDTAASDGVAVYVVIDDVEYLPGFNLGHLEFVSPTDAHGTCTLKTGITKTLLIADDDDAATNGTALKVQDASAGLMSAMAGSNRTLIPLSNGTFLDIEDGASGTDVYFDENGAQTYERLEAVNIGNDQEAFTVLEPSHLRVRPGTPLGPLAKLVSVSPHGSMSVGEIGSSGPQFQVSHDPAAAQMPGAALLTVIAAGAGFDAVLGGKQDVFIPTDTGEYIKVAYAASSTGVQVYWDADAATADIRLVAVVVDTADEAIACEAAVGAVRDTPVGTINAVTATAGSEVANGVDVGAVNFAAFGRLH